MEVVLLENIKNLGQIGDIVKVKRGHGRNFLIKYGKALRASKKNIDLVNKKKAELNEKNLEITESPITAKNLSNLINLIKDGTISGKIAKTVFELMSDGDKNPVEVVKEKGLKQESDPKELEKLIEKVINENQDKVKEYKSGKEKLFGFFVGQAMKVSGGKANPQLVNEILKKKLK